MRKNRVDDEKNLIMNVRVLNKPEIIWRIFSSFQGISSLDRDKRCYYYYLILNLLSIASRIANRIKMEDQVLPPHSFFHHHRLDKILEVVYYIWGKRILKSELSRDMLNTSHCFSQILMYD